MDYSRYKHLGVERDGDVLTITLQGPHPKNGFNGGMHSEMGQIFGDVRSDDVKVVVLTAVGDYFCVAGDMDWYATQDHNDKVRISREVRQFINDSQAIPQPLVLKLNGDAFGLGASLVSFADIIVAAEGATIGDRHTAMGLAAGDGGAMMWPLTMGIHRARQFFLLDRDFTAEELYEMGIVTKVVPRADLDAATDEVVQKLLGRPAEAVQWTKMVLNRMLRFSTLLSAESAVAHQAWSWHLDPSQDFIADIRAGRLSVHND